MNTSAPPTHNGRLVDRYVEDALVIREPEAAEQLIARVLRRAHRQASDRSAPDEEPVVL